MFFSLSRKNSMNVWNNALKYLNNVPTLTDVSHQRKKTVNCPNIPHSFNIIYLNIETFIDHKYLLIADILFYKPLTLILTEARCTYNVECIELYISRYAFMRCDSSSRHIEDVLMYVRRYISFKTKKMLSLVSKYWCQFTIVSLFTIRFCDF